MHTVFVSSETEKRMGEALFQQVRCLPVHDTAAMPRQSARPARCALKPPGCADKGECPKRGQPAAELAPCGTACEERRRPHHSESHRCLPGPPLVFIGQPRVDAIPHA